MATLAVMLKQRGLDVRGSDTHPYPPTSEFLAAHGITPLDGYRAEHISRDLDLVIVGNTASRGNPEVEAMLDEKIQYCSFPEIVRDQFLWTKQSIVISGTHGKTTTASMVAWILAESGADPSFLIGGMPKNFYSSGRLGEGKAFVIEGDEYDSAFFDKTAKFLKYLPDVVVVNSVEFDHADIYQDLDELRLAFRRLLQLVPNRGRVLLCADDPEARALEVVAPCKTETFGLGSQADWRAANIEHDIEATSFAVMHDGETVAEFTLPLLGTFNVRNALAATAVADGQGVPPSRAAAALSRFRGVRRRLEVRGVVGGVTVYDDFAHHPTAVRETLQALQATSVEGRVWALFEPRSATACRRVFQQEFAEALQLADEVVVAAVYRSTVPDDERLSEPQLAADVSARGTPARYLPTVDQVVAVVGREARAGDRVVAMSNGDFGGIHERLLAALSRDD